MDPTANLKEQREIIDRVNSPTYQFSTCCDMDADMDRLCELVKALDEWISWGGSLPEQWIID